jgi:cyclopropane fatty-acyl-phospholipid synthase-like methyltransferase
MPSREYYEELWRGVPHGLEPSDFALRARFLADGVAAGARVLDVGCGEGRFAAELAVAGASVRATLSSICAWSTSRDRGSSRTRASTWCGPAR